MSHVEDPVKEAGFTELCGSLEKSGFSKHYSTCPVQGRHTEDRHRTQAHGPSPQHKAMPTTPPTQALRTQDLQRPRVPGTDWQIPERQTWRGPRYTI